MRCRPARAAGARAAALARVPAFWVVLALLVAGGVRMAQFAERFVGTYPLATVTAVAAVRPARRAVLAAASPSSTSSSGNRPSCWRWRSPGARLVATTVSIPASAALEDLVAKLGSPHLAADWGAALAAPTVEETAKTLGVVAIVLVARSQVNSVLDGVVYGAMVGLGFQIAEDIVFAVGAVALAGQGDQVQPVVATFLLRGFLSGVWSHTLFGALAGAGIGYLVVRRDRRLAHRIGVALLAGARRVGLARAVELAAVRRRPRQRRAGAARRAAAQGPAAAAC